MVKQIPTLKELVRDKRVQFSHYRQGNLYYTVRHDGQAWMFPVDIADTGEASFLNEDKAIFFMRYIRRAIKYDELKVAE